MTVLGIILAVCIFGVAFWLIDRKIAPGSFKNILVGIVVVLALLVLLQGFGLLNLLNTPITGGSFGRIH